VCDCEFTPYSVRPNLMGSTDVEEESWHYLRKCENCGMEWYGLHCPHDGYQNPCPCCGIEPTVIADK